MTPESRTLERPMAKSIVATALLRSTIRTLAGLPNGASVWLEDLIISEHGPGEPPGRGPVRAVFPE
jgi:hypothetical protein